VTNFYTDESPGIKVSPVSISVLDTTLARIGLAPRRATSTRTYQPWGYLQVAVMILSLGFIAFVTLLHIVGKVSHDLCISQRWTQLLVSRATGLMHTTINGFSSLCCSCEGIDSLGWPYPSVNNFGPRETWLVTAISLLVHVNCYPFLYTDDA